jgi:hypothetical protein
METESGDHPLSSKLVSGVISLEMTRALNHPRHFLLRALHTLTAEEEIRHYSCEYSARLSVHPKDLTVHLMVEPDYSRQL